MHFRKLSQTSLVNKHFSNEWSKIAMQNRHVFFKRRVRTMTCYSRFKNTKKVGRVGLLSFYLDVIYIQKVLEFILCAHVTLPTYFAYKCGWNTSYVDLSSNKKNGWIVWNIINSCKNICKKFESTMECHNWYNSL